MTSIPRTLDPRLHWFVAARYGLFVHYGLYSLLGRGEWVRNREQIPRAEYSALAERFTAERFDAGVLCDFAQRCGMRYLVFTTMHHDGFCLYDSELTAFCTTKTAARRDLVAEVMQAAKIRGLRVGLYHSLNSWHERPDAVAALEDAKARTVFVDRTLERVEELIRRFPTADVLWYDGWWPFDAAGWRAAEMDERVRALAPHLLCNARNGLAGDFATPENHITAPRPWRPWEACLTLNESWGFHAGDHDWKSPRQIADALIKVAAGRGNLLLNVGPRGDGSLPERAVEILETTGRWLHQAGESIFDTDPFTWDLRERGEHRGDWCHHGAFTARGRALYLHVRRWPGETLALGGLETAVRDVSLLGHPATLAFEQTGDRVMVRGLPAVPPDPVGPVLRFNCETAPRVYQTAGMRVPRVAHPHYDPVASDLQI